jgi:peroxiredoxin
MPVVPADLAAISALLLPLGCIAWNMLVPKRSLRAWFERGATGTGVALGLAGLVMGSAGAWFLIGLIGLLLASLLFALTFLSRLPHQPPAFAVGERAPPFTLNDSNGVARRPQDFSGRWIVLKFFRGYWCPYCVADLNDWENVLGELAVRDACLVAVSPDNVDELHKFKRKSDLTMTLLADPDNAVIRRYNLQNRNFTPKRGPFRELVIPSIILIDPHGVVRWIDQATDFRIRRSAQDAMAQIRIFLPDSGEAADALRGEREKVVQDGEHREEEQADAEAEADQSPLDGAHRLARRSTAFVV